MCELRGRGSVVDRAGFLRGMAGTFTAAAIPSVVRARTRDSRALWLRRGSEEVNAYFTLDGSRVYNPGYFEICRMLRDTHVPLAEGDVLFDIRTIEALYEIQEVLRMVGVSQPIDVYSGYRTAATNVAVEGALNSFHLRAQAADFGVEGVSMEYLWEVCKSRPITGGLGYYSSHIHVDCRPQRVYW